MNNPHYIYRVEWSPEDQEYLGLCTEFPSLSWLGETYEEAFSGIRALVAQALEDMHGNGETPPKPLKERSYSGKITFRTTPELHQKLVVKATESHVSLNRYINSKLPGVLS